MMTLAQFCNATRTSDNTETKSICVFCKKVLDPNYPVVDGYGHCPDCGNGIVSCSFAEERIQCERELVSLYLKYWRRGSPDGYAPELYEYWRQHA